MTETINLDLERLRRLPRLEGETWQLAVVKMPQWIVGEARPPYRPLVAVCRSAGTGLVGLGEPYAPEEVDRRSPLDALGCLAHERGTQHGPSLIEVRDPALVERLRDELEQMGIEVVWVERLPLIDDLYADMMVGLSRGGGVPSCLGGRGVDVERLRSFADAAAAFFRAAPWNQLSDMDLLRVESPVPDRRLKWFTVLGGGGIERGIGFHPSALDHELMQEAEIPSQVAFATSRWLLTYGPIHEIPIPDADLWEDHRLPVAEDRAYPSLYRFDAGAVSRADAAVLTWVEGVLRALAASGEDDLDSGRWAKRVETFDGEQTIALSIPELLQPRKAARSKRAAAFEMPDRRLMERTLLDLQRAVSEREFESVDEVNRFLASAGGDVPHRKPTTPAERAQDLFYEALEARGRLRVRLAREALRQWPDCADAWVLLAEEMPDRERRAELYTLALEASERTLGKQPFEEHIGHFWGMVETRPYMRARFGLATCLWERGREEEAFAHCRELLRLNPRDNQGVRFFLVPRLLSRGRDDEAGEVLAGFEEDISAETAYARILLEFRRAGPEQAARGLEAASKRNPHVAKYLMGNARIPEPLPRTFRLGSEEEAAIAASELMEPWRGTPGAVEWLRSFRRDAKKKRDKKRTRAKDRR